MANRTISTSIRLEGEQQFRQAMKGASDAIKVLNSEQKLAKAQFEATGDKEKYMADQADILRRKIEEQQKAVNAAQEAVTKLKEQGVDPSNKSMQTWTRELNESKAYLTRLEGQLSRTEADLAGQEEAFDGAADAAGEYSAQLQSIGRGVDFQNTITSLDRVQGALNTALDVVQQTATAIYNAETDAAKWADELLTASQKAGIDVETYQSWQYASQFIDTEVEAIIKSKDKLREQLKTGNEEIELIFNQLGIATRDEAGNVRDYNDVFWETIDALNQTTDAHGQALTETVKDTIAQALFGRSFRELLPLIEGGSEAWGKLAEEGREVATVSEENVQKLGALDDAQNRLNSKLNKTQMTILAGMAPAFTTATDQVGGLVDEFNRFLETDEGREAMEKLNDAVGALLETLLGDVSAEDIIGRVTSAIEGLNNVLGWLAENGGTVVAVLAGVKGIVAGITIAKGILEALTLMKSINWLNMQKGAQSLGEAMSGGGAEQLGKTMTQGKAGGASDSASPIDAAGLTTWERTKQFFKQLPGKAAQFLPTAAAIGADATIGAAIVSTPLVGIAAGAIGEQKYYEKNFGEAAEAIEKYAETMHAEGDERVKQMQELLETYAGLFESDGPSGRAFFDMISKDYETLNNLLGGNSWLSADNVSTENLLERLKSGTAGDLFDWDVVGGNIVAGLTKGIEDNASTASDAAAEMAQSVQDAVTDTLNMNSPSVVLYNDGVNVAQGLADGINARAAAAIAAAASLAARVQAAMQGAQAVNLGGLGMMMSGAIYSAPSYGSAYGGGGRASTGVINNILNIDGRQFASVMTPYVSQDMALEVRADRR